MPIGEHLARIRQLVGTELLLMPSVSVLPQDREHRVLLVQQADTEHWATIGGAVEVDEDPTDAAIREAREEAGITVALEETLGVFGGPEFRVRCPNGDETAYVATVYAATILSGDPHPDGEETLDCGWFSIDRLDRLRLDSPARATFRRLGWL